MEEHVGMIANNPNYKLEELEKLYTASASPTMSQSSPPGEDQLVNPFWRTANRASALWRFQSGGPHTVP